MTPDEKIAFLARLIGHTLKMIHKHLGPEWRPLKEGDISILNDIARGEL